MQGMLLGGRYLIQNSIGEGGMAYVYVANDTKLNRLVAIKVLHSHMLKNQGIRERFCNEAQAVSRVEHPNIINIYDYSGPESEQLWIVMELINGWNVTQYIEKTKSTKLHPVIATFIIREVCKALEKAHKIGLVHRDIKPENIMLTQNGHLKLMDFGIAKDLASNSMTQTGTFMGSPSYMSPEQIKGQNVDHRSDLYSLCILYYEIITGKLPFVGMNTHDVVMRIMEGKFTTPNTLIPNLPPIINDIISKGIQKKPEQRFQNASELAHQIDLFLASRNFVESHIELERYFSNPKEYIKGLSTYGPNNTFNTNMIPKSKPSPFHQATTKEKDGVELFATKNFPEKDQSLEKTVHHQEHQDNLNQQKQASGFGSLQSSLQKTMITSPNNLPSPQPKQATNPKHRANPFPVKAQQKTAYHTPKQHQAPVGADIGHMPIRPKPAPIQRQPSIMPIPKQENRQQKQKEARTKKRRRSKPRQARKQPLEPYFPVAVYKKSSPSVFSQILWGLLIGSSLLFFIWSFLQYQKQQNPKVAQTSSEEDIVSEETPHISAPKSETAIETKKPEEEKFVNTKPKVSTDKPMEKIPKRVSAAPKTYIKKSTKKLPHSLPVSPKPKPQAGQVSHFSIQSTPASIIYVNGKKMGTTNGNLQNPWLQLKPGTHSLELKRHNYVPFTTEFTLEAGQKLELDAVSLERVSTPNKRVKFYSPEIGYLIEVKDHTTGKSLERFIMTSHHKEITLPENKYEIVIQYEDKESTRNIDLSYVKRSMVFKIRKFKH